MVKIELRTLILLPILTLLMFSILFMVCDWLRLYIRTFCERCKNYFAECAIYFSEHSEHRGAFPNAPPRLSMPSRRIQLEAGKNLPQPIPEPTIPVVLMPHCVSHS